MKEEFSDLVRYLDDKFRDIDDKFERVDRQLQDVSQKVLNLDDKLNNLQYNKVDKSDINNLLDVVNDCAQKIDRHEKWLRQIAEKFNITLDY